MADDDPTLFVRLLLRSQNDLLRFIAPLVGSMEDAQDVLQETAMGLWKKFGEYDPSQPFLNWAKGFARFEVLMHHRKSRRFTFLTDELIETLAARQAEREGISERRRTAIAECMGKLPERDRTLLEKRYAEPGTRIWQLADSWGQTPNALYKTLGRIRRQLLRCVDRRLAIEGP